MSKPHLVSISAIEVIDMVRVLIYVDSKTNNDVFIIKQITTKNLGSSIPLLDYEHPSFNEKEKDLLRPFLMTLVNDYRLSEEEIPAYLKIVRGEINDSLVAQMNNFLEEYNAINNKQSERYDYFRYSYRPLTKTYKSEPILDTKIVEKSIANETLLLISDEEVNKLTKQYIESVIKHHKETKEDFYIVAYCPVCEKNSIFVCSNGSKTGLCEKCQHKIDFTNKTDTYFEGKNYANASEVLKKHNVLPDDIATNDDGIFRYRGKPYKKEQFNDLFAIVYKNKDADAFFNKDSNGRISFKEKFLNYLRQLPRAQVASLTTQLDNIQVDSDVYHFDEFVALFWFYERFPLARNSLNEKERNILFTKVGTINSPLEYVDKFLKADSQEQAYLLSLLNPTYINYFFDKEGLYFNDDYYLGLSKLIFKLTQKYVYISHNEKRIETILDRSFLSPKLLYALDDKTYDRYQIIDKLFRNDVQTFLGEDYHFSINYVAKRPDGYDLVTYFALLYLNADYYRYLDLQIPIDANKAKDSLKEIVTEGYLYHRYERLDLLVFIYKNNYLDTILTNDVQELFDKFLKSYKNHENILDVYLNIYKSYGLGINDVLILYQGNVATVYNLAKKAASNKWLRDLAKDKVINHVIDTLVDNKVENDLAIEKQFNEVDKKITNLLEGY